MRLKVYTSVVGLLVILTASCTSGGDGGVDQELADLILTGATIFTSNPQQAWAESVAVKDGRVIYVGDATGATRFRADHTQVVDLDGRLVIPGLIDSHAHPGYIEVEQYGAINEADEEAMLDAVRRYADEHPDDEWLRLCCWPVSLYVKGNQGPDKRILDAVVPDRPVWFVSEWWHSGWLNSKALEVLGVDRDTLDPKTGVATYVRNENGEPTGWVKEGAGWQHFAEHFPIDDERHKKLQEENIVTALELLSESGVTTLYDAGNFGFDDLVYDFIARLEDEGRLPVRYEGTYQVFTPERRHLAASEMARYRREYGGDRLQFNTVKLFMDGIYQNRTSALLEPFVDDPSYVGETLLSVIELRDFLLELSAEQLDIHIHTEGDLAVRRVLDAVESAQGIAKDDFYTRVTISHLGLIDPTDLPRIAELGVICNFTPWWFTTERGDPERASLGDERFGRMFNPKPLIDLGVDVTFSSDEWWGGDKLSTYLNPYFGIQVGHTRQYPGGWRDQEEIVRPPGDGQLGLEQLIMGYTQNGAYQLRMEDEIGSIEEGKRADLIVFDDNLFEIDSDKIWKARPAVVFMDGDVIQGALPGEKQR